MKPPFNIILVSSSIESKKIFPNNNQMAFSIQLPKRLDLKIEPEPFFLLIFWPLEPEPLEKKYQESKLKHLGKKSGAGAAKKLAGYPVPSPDSTSSNVKHTSRLGS